MTGGQGLRMDLCVPEGQALQWHVTLLAKLRNAGVRPEVIWTGQEERWPAGVDTLLTFEKMLRPRPAPRLSDRVTAAALALPNSGEPGAIRLVLSGAALGPDDSTDGTVWHVLFDGQAGDIGLAAALLNGRPPHIEIVDRSGVVLVAGTPSIEAAAGFCEAYEAVVARLTSLVIKAVNRPGQASPVVCVSSVLRAPGPYLMRQLSWALARRLYQLCCYTPHWRVGWRASKGGTVWDRQSLDGEPWKSLPDPGHRFYADPFPFHWQGRTHLFVEDFDHRTQRGVISAIGFDDRGPTGPMVPVLEEGFHLSYPFLFVHDDQVWMIPETSQNRTVSLYRARTYPTGWIHVCDLLTDVVASDATLIRHDGRWWMFAALHDGEGAHSDMLGLFMADTLFGPWVPHPLNPIVIDAGCARPAGNLVVRNGRLWRPAQDCTQLYGGGLALAEITVLTDTDYRQVVRARLKPGPSWPGRRLHTLNCAGGIEVVDGSATSYRYRLNRRRAA